MTVHYMPEREPDKVVLGNWYFWWDEMVQWNAKQDHMYHIKVQEDGVYFFNDLEFDDEYALWTMFGDNIVSVEDYLEWASDKLEEELDL